MGQEAKWRILSLYNKRKQVFRRFLIDEIQNIMTIIKYVFLVMQVY